MDDMINPKHYQLRLPSGESIEAIDYIRAVLGERGALAYCHGSALKYLSRAGNKDGQPAERDLRKAAWFCLTAAHIIEDNEEAESDDIDWDAV